MGYKLTGNSTGSTFQCTESTVDMPWHECEQRFARVYINSVHNVLEWLGTSEISAW